MGLRGAWVILLGACSYAPTSSLAPDAGIDAPPDVMPDMPPPVAGRCDPIPRSSAATLVSTVADLRQALAAAAPGDSIELADGTYVIAATAIRIGTAGVTLRSASGDASKVILDGAGNPGRLVLITASNVTLTEVTLAHSGDSGLIVSADPTGATITGVRIHDVTFDDDSGPAMRIDANGNVVDGPFADNGTISCSRFVDTPTGADHCAPGILGIDGIAVRGWTVRDNLFQDMRCDGGFARNVVFRFGSRDVTITDNVFTGSNANILLGGETTSRDYADAPRPECIGLPDFRDGVVCNNVIDGQQVPPNTVSTTDFEEGIAAWYACDSMIAHNTIASPAAPETFHDIEYRFSSAYVHLVNNLLEQQPAARNSGQQDPAFATSNVTYDLANFVDPATGDLHLAAAATVQPGVAIDTLGSCAVDHEGKPRDLAAPDPGAYER